MLSSEMLNSTITLRRNFEELPLFWRAQQAAADKPPITWRGVRVDGEFEVAYNVVTDDWFVSDVWLVCDNGQCGRLALDHLVNLDADDDERFYFLVLDAIENRYTDTIEEMIEEHLSTSEIRRVA